MRGNYNSSISSIRDSYDVEQEEFPLLGKVGSKKVMYYFIE